MKLRTHHHVGIGVFTILVLAACGTVLADTSSTPSATSSATASASASTSSPTATASSTASGTVTENPVTIPNVPFSAINGGQELVTLPGDSPTISESQAQTVATQWAENYAGTTTFSSVTLARVQNVDSAGSPTGPPGTLQWIFAIVGPSSFASQISTDPYNFGTAASSSAATPSAYPYPEHYALISIDATTGQMDGMRLT